LGWQAAIFILLLYTALGYFSVKPLGKYPTETLLAGSIFLLGLYQPFFVYYSTGPVGMFTFMLYALLGLILSLIFLVKIFKSLKFVPLPFVLGSIGILLGLGIFFYGDSLENIDWSIHRAEREKIIEKLKKDYSGENFQGLVQLNSYFPLSNGGNEVYINMAAGQYLTVKFWIDRGFLDSHSEFVYTDNPSDIEDLDRIIKQHEDYTTLYRKIDEHWYRVNDWR
jgi:hypothetical protein